MSVLLWLPREARGAVSGADRRVGRQKCGQREGAAGWDPRPRGGLHGAQTQGWGGRGSSGRLPLPSPRLGTCTLSLRQPLFPPVRSLRPTISPREATAACTRPTQTCPRLLQAGLRGPRLPTGRFIGRITGLIKPRRNRGARAPPVTASQINERGRGNRVCRLCHCHGAKKRLTAPRPTLGFDPFIPYL